MTKSYVTIEKHQCPVCGKLHDTNSILFHKRLQPVFDSSTVTGLSLCPDDKTLHEAGYVAMVEIEEPKNKYEKLTPYNAVRTGVVIHLRRTVAGQIFNMPVDHEFVYIDSEVTEKLKLLKERQQEDTAELAPQNPAG